jgi:hypothetical protein
LSKELDVKKRKREEFGEKNLTEPFSPIKNISLIRELLLSKFKPSSEYMESTNIDIARIATSLYALSL